MSAQATNAYDPSVGSPVEAAVNSGAWAKVPTGTMSAKALSKIAASVKLDTIFIDIIRITKYRGCRAIPNIGL
jgi:hypothetical protein